jgi:hypothetical protein
VVIVASAIKTLGRKSMADDWLGEAIDSYYHEECKSSWREVKHLISPSGCWNVCPRAVQFRQLGYSPRFSAQTRRRMDNGTGVHTRWEAVFAEMGIVVMEEKFMAGAEFGGTPDNLLHKPGNKDERLLTEIKSINQNGWRKLPWAGQVKGVYRGAAFAPSNMAALAKAQPRHIAQWLAYDRILLENGHDIGKGVIFYECKDNQQYGYFFVVRDDPLFEALTDNAREALKWNRKGNLMGMPFRHTSSQCKGCDAQNICHRIDAGDEALKKKVRARLQQTKQSGKLRE